MNINSLWGRGENNSYIKYERGGREGNVSMNIIWERPLPPSAQNRTACNSVEKTGKKKKGELEELEMACGEGGTATEEKTLKK